MDPISKFKLKVRRADGPVYRLLHRLGTYAYCANLPLPEILRPFFRILYSLHWSAVIILRRLYVMFYAEPLFRGRCTTVGNRLSISKLPFIVGHTELHIGTDVTFGGSLFIVSGRFCDVPRLIIQDGCTIAGGVSFSVNREIIIEENVMIGPNCRIQDSDGHPRDAEARARKAALTDRDIRPVRICRSAWIGAGSHIMKGVQIGEGAIIGANSVVISNIAPFTVAFGNPAEVYFRNVGRPKRSLQ